MAKACLDGGGRGLDLVLWLPEYQGLFDDPCCYPLGFMYISAVLKRLGHRVKVLNGNLGEHDLSAEMKGTDALLMTGFRPFLPEIERAAALCREMGVKTILGGGLATFAPDEMSRHVDTVVVGEGEAVMDRGFVLQGEPYSPETIEPEVINPQPVRQQGSPQPVYDAVRPVAGMIPLKRLALPPQTAAIAGESGGVIMPQNFNAIVNPAGMSGRDIAAARRRLQGGR